MTEQSKAVETLIQQESQALLRLRKQAEFHLERLTLLKSHFSGDTFPKPGQHSKRGSRTVEGLILNLMEDGKYRSSHEIFEAINLTRTDNPFTLSYVRSKLSKLTKRGQLERSVEHRGYRLPASSIENTLAEALDVQVLEPQAELEAA